MRRIAAAFARFRELAETGLSRPEIAEELGVSRPTITRWAEELGIALPDGRSVDVRAARAAQVPTPADDSDESPAARPQPRGPRSLHKTLHRAAIPAATRAFAAGEIDRAELMRRITAEGAR